MKFVALFLIAASAWTQQVAGTVVGVNADAQQLTLKSDRGDSLPVTTTGRTVFLRIPAGVTDRKQGIKITLGDVSAGDRAIVTGPAAAATAVLVMSKSDIASLHQRDQEDWKKRGAAGIVTQADAGSGSFTIRNGPHIYKVQFSGQTIFQRYSLDSARFSDATASSAGEVKNGDQVRVLGNRSEDGTEIRAERVVSGIFRQIAATVTSVNAASGELIVMDLATKKPLTIKVTADSTMKKLPDQAAKTLAKSYAPGTQPAAGRAADAGQILDGLGAMPFSELKPGDAIMVCTTQGSDPGRVTAIVLLAGVEPLLTASPAATRDILTGWTLGGADTGQ